MSKPGVYTLLSRLRPEKRRLILIPWGEDDRRELVFQTSVSSRIGGGSSQNPFLKPPQIFLEISFRPLTIFGKAPILCSPSGYDVRSINNLTGLII